MLSNKCEYTSTCAKGNKYPVFVERFEQTRIGIIPIVSTEWTWRERLDSCKVHWGLNRMNYKVEPGIYGVGHPDSNSPVLVSANYKLSFDKLRQELNDIDTWILVIDTNGINVWCAAGKGTFGTKELVKRIRLHCLPQLVDHNKIIIPQLAGPGVAAYQVTKQTKFRVVYGPVRAKDIPAFMANKMHATPDMRIITFSFKDRIVLTPMEFLPALKLYPIFIILLFLLNWISSQPITRFFLVESLPYLGGIFLGSVVVPLLLPYIPFRSFAMKGAVVGMIFVLALHQYAKPDVYTQLAHFLIIPSLASFLAVNFTGATPFTSLSGVQKELTWSVPIYISAVIAGLTLKIIHVLTIG